MVESKVLMSIFQHLPRGAVWIQGMVYGHPLSSMKSTLWKIKFVGASLFLPIWGVPKIGCSILIGFSIFNHPFWGTPIFGNTHMTLLNGGWQLADFSLESFFLETGVIFQTKNAGEKGMDKRCFGTRACTSLQIDVHHFRYLYHSQPLRKQNYSCVAYT